MTKEDVERLQEVIMEVYKRAGHIMGPGSCGVGKNEVIVLVTSEEIKAQVEPLIADLPARVKIGGRPVLYQETCEEQG